MDLQALGFGLVAAFIIRQITEKVLKEPLAALSQPTREERAAALVALWPSFVTLIVTGALAWATGLNLFPVFAQSALVGRIMSCLAIGLGPSFLHDLASAVRSGSDAAQVAAAVTAITAVGDDH